MNALNKIQYKYATWRNLRRQFLSEQATLAEVRELCMWRGTCTGTSSRNHSPVFRGFERDRNDVARTDLVVSAPL